MNLLVVALVTLWVLVLVLAVVVFGLARQVGALYERVASTDALMSSQPLRPGDAAPSIAMQTLEGVTVETAPTGAAQLLFFIEPDCPICKSLLPVLKTLSKADPQLAVVLVSDGATEHEHRQYVAAQELSQFDYALSDVVARTFGARQLPFAVLINTQGVVASLGVVNSKEHLESLFEAQSLDIASSQERPERASDAQEAGYRPPPQISSTPQFDYQSDDDIGLVARVHFATHTPDFDRAWAFYQLLGYSTGRSGFPLTNTHLMARALGMFDLCQYELARGAVIDIPDSLNTVSVDLLQFKTPFNDDPPYELPNHLGMAYAGMLTTDLDADYAFLRSKSVDFLSAPYGERGERFAFFRDVDGVLYKLMEDAAHNKPAAADAKTAQVIAMPYVGINVSDLDTSLDFYRRLGYTDVTPIPQRRGTLEEAQAYGLDAPFEYKGADVTLGRGDKHSLRLLQWITPFNPEPPYPAPINHIGIHRIAVVVADMERAVSILKRQGVEFLSEIAPCCSGTAADEMAIVHAIDPDGIFVELVGPISPRPLVPQPAHCGPLEIKLPNPEDIKDFTQGP